MLIIIEEKNPSVNSRYNVNIISTDNPFPQLLFISMNETKTKHYIVSFQIYSNISR